MKISVIEILVNFVLFKGPVAQNKQPQCFQRPKQRIHVFLNLQIS